MSVYVHACIWAYGMEQYGRHLHAPVGTRLRLHVRKRVRSRLKLQQKAALSGKRSCPGCDRKIKFVKNFRGMKLSLKECVRIIIIIIIII